MIKRLIRKIRKHLCLHHNIKTDTQITFAFCNDCGWSQRYYVEDVTESFTKKWEHWNE